MLKSNVNRSEIIDRNATMVKKNVNIYPQTTMTIFLIDRKRTKTKTESCYAKRTQTVESGTKCGVMMLSIIVIVIGKFQIVH